MDKIPIRFLYAKAKEEIGKLLSYIDELEYELKSKDNLIQAMTKDKSIAKEIKKEELYKLILLVNKNQAKKIIELRNHINLLYSKLNDKVHDK